VQCGEIQGSKTAIGLIFREPGEKWLADCIQPKEKDKGIWLMVWGCFWGKGKGPLVPIT